MSDIKNMDPIEILNDAYEKAKKINQDLTLDPFMGRGPVINAILFLDTETVRKILEAGGDPNECQNDGSTALHLSAFNNKPESVRLLIKHGAEIDPRDENDRTPLHDAVFKMNVEAVKMLVEAGASTEEFDSYSETPEEKAERMSHFDPRAKEIEEYLMRNRKTKHKNTKPTVKDVAAKTGETVLYGICWMIGRFSK